MESELLAHLRRRLPSHPRLLLGPGDDAAILQMGRDPRCVVTVDLISDEVDFHLSQVDVCRVGRKALAVNLSDLAAMAARPLAAVVALLLPREGSEKIARELYEGLVLLAEEFDLAIAGGDINAWDHPLAVSITALGEVTENGPLVRSGARPGDVLLVTGALGGSILGRHFDFQPRVHEALLLNERYDLHAGIDISDGLAIDLARLCQESGCGALVRTADVPISEDAHHLASHSSDGVTALEHALGDGEDFELLLALPPEEARRLLAEQPLNTPLTPIGECQEQPGLRQADAEGKESPLEVTGFLH